jgi:hypothetical protein
VNEGVKFAPVARDEVKNGPQVNKGSSPQGDNFTHRGQSSPLGADITNEIHANSIVLRPAATTRATVRLPLSSSSRAAAMVRLPRTWKDKVDNFYCFLTVIQF